YGQEGDAVSVDLALSSDGLTVAFDSYASNLVAGDTNGNYDTFVFPRSRVEASSSDYGSGFAGERGDPTLAPEAPPVLGSTLTLDLGSSSSHWTVGYLLVGTGRQSLGTKRGGTLLVDDLVFCEAFPMSPYGTTWSADLPEMPILHGVAVDAQFL